MMKKLVVFILLLTNQLFGQFNYSGYIYNSNSVGIPNIPIKLFKRTTSNLAGFTSQTNYNGHSYYRSTTTANWTTAQANCVAMNGHLVTISNAAENTFVFNTWPSGWIGYYQDKTGNFYGEPNAGWRWTENYVTTNQQADYDVASYTSGNILTDIKSSINTTLTNNPTYTNSGGKYLTFNGINQYGITGNLASKFTSTKVSLLAWIYPTGNGVVVTELGAGSPSSGWHDAQIEITGGNTLRCGLWNGGMVQVSTSITLNAWHLVGFTYDGTTLTGYKDGVAFATINTARQAPYYYGNGLYYGIGLTDFTNMGSGAYGNFRLGSFQVYSNALTADEMNRNYMSTAWRFGIYPYSNWNGGEPNNSGGEDYIQFVGSGRWNDLNNNNSLNYVLEFDYIFSTGSWELYKTIHTDSNGKYTITETTNPSIEWYIQIDAPTPNAITTFDAISANSKVLSRNINAWDYYKFDVNDDSKINISDVYYIYAKKIGKFTSWKPTLVNTRIFTPTQFSIINSSNSNLKTTYSGAQSIVINSPVSGGSSNYYIVNTGYAN
jgi:hypothetical protein